MHHDTPLLHRYASEGGAAYLSCVLKFCKECLQQFQVVNDRGVSHSLLGWAMARAAGIEFRIVWHIRILIIEESAELQHHICRKLPDGH